MKITVIVFLLLISLTEQPQSQVQQTFCRHGLNIPLLSHSTIKDSILVNVGQNCSLLDLNVKIDTFQHTWVSSARMYIRKSNAGVLMVNWVGGSGDNMIRTVLDDSAALSIHQGSAPFTGSYRPSNPFLPFVGINPNGYWTYVATDSGPADTGVLRAWCVILTVNCPVGGVQTLEIPSMYTLEQNYPNPFNPVTKIKYGLPENSYVELIVYDISGREVRTLVSGYREANTYEFDFDGTELPSGVYFYKLEIGSISLTRKMLLIK
jgi:hypothetical protein